MLEIALEAATVAQMVEQFTRNDQASGSIPLGGSKLSMITVFSPKDLSPVLFVGEGL